MVCRSVRFDIINLLTNLERHLQCVPGNLSSYEYFLLKTCCIRNMSFKNWVVTGSNAFGKKPESIERVKPNGSLCHR